MRTIAVINQKGGVGKSTTAFTLGAGLIHRGYKVLFVDLDPQGNLSLTMGCESSSMIKETLMYPENHPLWDSVERVRRLQWDIVPSSGALTTADSFMISNYMTVKEGVGFERMYRLKRALDGMDENPYDFCIIDTPPTLGVLLMNALTACTGAIVPAQAELYSLQGMKQLAHTVGVVKEYCNKDLKVLGVLLTRYTPRTVIRRELAGQISVLAEKSLGTRVFDSYIRECTALVEAQTMGVDIFTYNKRSNAAKDYAAFVEEFLKAEKSQ